MVEVVHRAGEEIMQVVQEVEEIAAWEGGTQLRKQLSQIDESSYFYVFLRKSDVTDSMTISTIYVYDCMDFALFNIGFTYSYVSIHVYGGSKFGFCCT